jgi:hypothetical protein
MSMYKSPCSKAVTKIGAVDYEQISMTLLNRSLWRHKKHHHDCPVTKARALAQRPDAR